MKKKSSIIRLAALLLGLSAAPAFSALVLIDEHFNGTATLVAFPGSPSAPTGWSQTVRDATATANLGGGVLTINHVAAVSPTIYGNNTLLAPSGTKLTLKTNIVQYSGALNRSLTGFGVGNDNVGWSLLSNGDIRVSASRVGDLTCTTNVRCGVTLAGAIPSYDGRAVEVVFEADASGWTISVPSTGFSSSQTFEALDGARTGVISFADFAGASSQASLGLVGANSTTGYDRFQLYKAAPGDTVTAPPGSTTQSTPVTTTTLSVTGTSSVDQTAGTTTVLQTMTVDANGSYTLSGGTLDATTLDVNGTFDFAGGTLSVDEFQGNLGNTQSGTLSPGNSPGLTTVIGDYTQDGAGKLVIELAGLNVVSYDRLGVTGTATLGGVLDLNRLYGFMPSLGDTFDILTAETLNDTFDSVWVPTLPVGLTWNIQYLTDAIGSTDVVRLSAQEVVPIPTAVWLFGSALGVMGVVRRKLSS